MSRVFDNWYDNAERYLWLVHKRTGYDHDYLMDILDDALNDYWTGEALEETLDEVLLDVSSVALELDYADI